MNHDDEIAMLHNVINEYKVNEFTAKQKLSDIFKVLVPNSGCTLSPKNSLEDMVDAVSTLLIETFKTVEISEMPKPKAEWWVASTGEPSWDYKRNQAAYMEAHTKVKKSIRSPLDN
jgi:hypothetical protein